ncbi:MAG: toprim domain-containing protein [Sphingomonadaceae bacterium]|nr:toprim domain-containing protein [Sphingomonadaceae bacterium]
MHGPATELAHRLARDADAVCRHYLPNGRREGRYWLVGDIENTPGRSLFVRLEGPRQGKGAAGKWTDAATGEHGDLIDLIAANQRLSTLRDALDEARRFLSLPRPEPSYAPSVPAPTGSPDAARRLFAMAKPIRGTVAEAYFRARGIAEVRDLASLRFHPRCYYRGDGDDPHDRVRDAWPALIAAVTDLHGAITGAHRTWIDPVSIDKAPVSTPRRSMGLLLGNGVRFGVAPDVLTAGEGLETMLSLKQLMPKMPMVAALSANHLAALELPATLRRVYLARDDDPAGRRAAATLAARARSVGVEALTLAPALGDFNEDLRRVGSVALGQGLRLQLAPEDIERFLIL